MVNAVSEKEDPANSPVSWKKSAGSVERAPPIAPFTTSVPIGSVSAPTNVLEKSVPSVTVVAPATPAAAAVSHVVANKCRAIFFNRAFFCIHSSEFFSTKFESDMDRSIPTVEIT